MIKSLSKDIQAKLRSGIAIFSLQQCVEELLLNSIDAGATCVAVKIDIEGCRVQVIDNGAGMNREDMERVGTRYCTSKCSSLDDLDKLRFYGFRGEAIASIVSLTSLVEISSRTKTSVKTFVKTFNEGKGLDVYEAQTTRPSAGTTVLICNVFHNMPVRRKRMDSALEIERIRQRVEAISLMHPSVSFTVKKECSGTMLVQLPKARNTYYRFVQIHGLGRAQKLREVNYTHSQFQMTGHIGREGHYNTSLQFVFVNSRLLLKTRIHKLLNCLLRKLSSTSAQDGSPNAASAFSSPKQRGGADLHAVYVINIKCHYSEYDVCLEPAKSLIEFQDWDSVLLCIEEGVKTFLQKENLVSELSANDIQSFRSVFSDVVSSPGRNANTPESGAYLRNTENDCRDTETCNSPWETVADKASVVQEEQSVEQIPAVVSPSTETRASSASDTEKEVQNDGIDNTTQITPVSVLLTEKGTEEKLVQDHEITHYPDVNDNDLLLGVPTNNITHCENSRISLFGDQEAHDSLSRFANLNLPCATKRKLSLLNTESHTKGYNEDCGIGPKMARVRPCRTLTLQFETGSLDKFKRMFGKGVEIKHQAIDGPITDNLRPTDCRTSVDCSASTVLNAGNSALNPDDKQARENKSDRSLLKESSLAHSARTTLKCSTLDNKKSKISLAAKLSHLKCNKVERKTILQCELEDSQYIQTVIADTLASSVTQDTESRERFTDSPQCVLENNEDFSKRGVVVASSGTSGPGEDDQSSQPRITAPSGQDTSTLSFTSATVDAQPSPKNTTSLEPDVPSGQIVNPASQHDLLPSKTGNEEQTPNERQSHESDGAELVSSDWLTHYDDSLGKLVYINQVTGLSKYDTPSVEETQVPCSTDVTNMAVSVISKTGFEYRCYPFQTEIVLPFLPKTRAERVLSSGTDSRDENQDPSSLSTLFSEWNNPVFIRPPQVAMDVTSGQAEGLAVKIHNILFPYRFTKDMMQSMKVIHQVDKKFLACLINTTGQNITGSSENEGNLLVLVDQHAAHERVRLEGLVTESYEDKPETQGKKRLCSSSVSPPLEISVTDEEMRLLRLYRPLLRDLALEISFPQAEEMHVLLKRLPSCFIEKECTEQRRGRRTVIKSIAKEYLREQIEFLQSTGRVRGTLPLTVHNVLASQACHGAIKFNNVLSKEECCSLVASLSSCQLPFQCAHGRPSIMPLVDLLHLEEEQDFPRPNLQKLRRMYKAWQLFGNN